MEALTKLELQQLCQRRGLSARGSKSDLIVRITASSKLCASAREIDCMPSAATDQAVLKALAPSFFPGNYSELTTRQLQDLCRTRLLPVGEDRCALVARLHAFDARREAQPDASRQTNSDEHLELLTVSRLKELCRERGLRISGLKGTLIERLQNQLGEDLSDPKSSASKKRKRSTSFTKLLSETTSPHDRTLTQASQASNLHCKQLSQVKPSSAQIRLNSSKPHQDLPAQFSMSEACYLVCIVDTWCSSAQPNQQLRLPYRLDRIFSTKAAANARVCELFYENGPHVSTEADLTPHKHEEHVLCEDELLNLSVVRENRTWSVKAIAVPRWWNAAVHTPEMFVVCASTMDHCKESRANLSMMLFYDFYCTKDTANAVAVEKFWEENPWKWTSAQCDKLRHAAVHDGMVSVSMTHEDQEWRVAVHQISSGEQTVSSSVVPCPPQSAEEESMTVLLPPVELDELQWPSQLHGPSGARAWLYDLCGHGLDTESCYVGDDLVSELAFVTPVDGDGKVADRTIGDEFDREYTL